MKNYLLAVTIVLGASWAVAFDGPDVLDGVVQPFRSSMVNAKTVGNVSKILVEEGQRVIEGNLLAQLDDTLAVANYELAKLQAEDTSALDAARLQLTQADIELQRVKGLAGSGTYAPTELEKAQYAYDVSSVAVKSKELDIKRLKAAAEARKAVVDEYAVRAPFSGIVAQKSIEVGETTAPIERRLFEVIDVSKVYVEVHPDTTQLTRIAVGDGAVVTSELLPGREFAGKVSFVSVSLDLTSRYFAARVLLDNAEGLLRPGMKARVRLPAEGKSQAAGTGEPAHVPDAGGTSK